MDALINGGQKISFTLSMINELGRLVQGNVAGFKSNDFVGFIHHQDVPNNSKVVYETIVCNYQPLKNDQYRLCSVVGVYKLDYALRSGLHASSMLKI